MSFTEKEKQFIIENYEKIQKKEIAKILGVSAHAVSAWCQYHGYSPKKLKFSEYEIEFMEENYNKMSYKDIGTYLGYTELQIRGKINNMGLSKVRKFNKRYFQKIDNSNKAYWLGFIYADGYVIKNEKNSNYELGIEINRYDEHHLQKFNEELGNVHKIYRKHKDVYIANNKQQSHVDTSVIRIYSREIVKDLENNGVIQNKTNIGSVFPKVEDAFFIDFLRGYIDGDGCIYIPKSNKYYKSQINITSCSDNILHYINNKLQNEFGVVGHIYEETNRKYRLVFFGKDNIMIFLDLLYKNKNCVKLERKFLKYLKLKSLYKALPIEI